MKHVNVPAQVTTIEDRIVGNLTLTQLSLLAAPIFINFGVYAALPKPMHLDLYKLILITITSLVLSVLSIRFRGKIMLQWTVTLTRFKFRNKLYVYDKNSLFLRGVSAPKNDEDGPVVAKDKIDYLPRPVSRSAPSSSLSDLRLNFIEERKGKLYVYVNER